MSNLRFAVLVLAIGCSGSALAPKRRRARRMRVGLCKFCAGTSPGGGRVVACLTKQQNQLSDACKKVLAGRKAK